MTYSCGLMIFYLHFIIENGVFVNITLLTEEFWKNVLILIFHEDNSMFEIYVLAGYMKIICLCDLKLLRISGYKYVL